MAGGTRGGAVSTAGSTGKSCWSAGESGAASGAVSAAATCTGWVKTDSSTAATATALRRSPVTRSAWFGPVVNGQIPVIIVVSLCLRRRKRDLTQVILLANPIRSQKNGVALIVLCDVTVPVKKILNDIPGIQSYT